MIDEVLKLLEETGWCNPREISKKLGLPEPEVEMILNFLARYDFAKLDEGRRRAKLSPPLLEFLENLRKAEERKA